MHPHFLNSHTAMAAFGRSVQWATSNCFIYSFPFPVSKRWWMLPGDYCLSSKISGLQHFRVGILCKCCDCQWKGFYQLSQPFFTNRWWWQLVISRRLLVQLYVRTTKCFRICIASSISSFVGIDLNFAKVPVTHDKFAMVLLSLFVLEIYEKQSLITFCKSMQ